VLLEGYIEKTAPDRMRIYTSLALDRWLDIARADIILISEPENASQPSRLLVAADTRVQLVRTMRAGVLDGATCCDAEHPIPLQGRFGLDSVQVMCQYIHGRVRNLLHEYRSASTARRDAILTELGQLGHFWNEIGCRRRYGDVSQMAIAGTLDGLPQEFANLG
jgi:hypothetical protein